MKRKLVWVALTLTLVALALWFEPTGVVRGWLRGEAFYQGRPTSYWSRELQTWTLAGSQTVRSRGKDGQVNREKTESLWRREPSFIDPWLPQAWRRTNVTMPHPPPTDSFEARNVLEELLNDPSDQVRTMARSGLDRLDEPPWGN